MGSRVGARSVPNTKGQSPKALEESIVLPWNDLSLVEDAFTRHGPEIAALITEPVMFNSGGIEPKPGYLRGLRDLCDRHGVMLVFDEVISGFRIAVGGAQEYFGVVPDLAVFGKAIAAGFPLSCVAGKREFMELISRREVAHAGTFNGNPISLAAAHAALMELSRDNGQALRETSKRAERLREGLVDAFRSERIAAVGQGVGPAFSVSLGVDEPLSDYRGFLRVDGQAYSNFAEAMLDQGILCLSRGMWYVSTVHTDQDIQRTIDAASKAAAAISRSGSKSQR
jgi:glutamate-1-semialdehyde 2,1-aminomutase